MVKMSTCKSSGSSAVTVTSVASLVGITSVNVVDEIF